MSSPKPVEQSTSVFDEVDASAEQAAIEEAERAIEQGRTISHEAMRRWLLSWVGDRSRVAAAQVRRIFEPVFALLCHGAVSTTLIENLFSTP